MRAPPLSFTQGTEYTINGQTLAFDTTSGRVKLWCPVTRSREIAMSAAELAKLRGTSKLGAASDVGTRHSPSGRPPPRLKDEVRARVVRRTAYATACAKLYPVGPKSERLCREIEEIAQRIGDRHRPSPHSVYRWMRRYVLSNYDTAVFVQDAGAIRQRKARVDPKAQELLRIEIQELLGAVGATLHGVMNRALARVAKQLGYPTFQTKEGAEFTPDEYLLMLGEEPSSVDIRGASHVR